MDHFLVGHQCEENAIVLVELQLSNVTFSFGIGLVNFVSRGDHRPKEQTCDFKLSQHDLIGS